MKNVSIGPSGIHVVAEKQNGFVKMKDITIGSSWKADITCDCRLLWNPFSIFLTLPSRRFAAQKFTYA